MQKRYTLLRYTLYITLPYPALIDIAGVLPYIRCIILNRVIQFKNLNLLFLTQKRHTRGWGQIIKPTHIVMVFSESLVRFVLTMKKLYIISLIINTFGFGQTDVSGAISSSTTWDASGSPYIINGNVIVMTGVTLTISGGENVKFSLRRLEMDFPSLVDIQKMSEIRKTGHRFAGHTSLLPDGKAVAF